MAVAVGTLITERPPHRTVHAAFPHTAPTSGSDGNWPYALQRLWHAYPVLRPVRVVLARISLASTGSAAEYFRLVRRLHGYYDGVRLPASVHHRLRLLAFPMRAAGVSR